MRGHDQHVTGAQDSSSICNSVRPSRRVPLAFSARITWHPANLRAECWIVLIEGRDPSVAIERYQGANRLVDLYTRSFYRLAPELSTQTRRKCAPGWSNAFLTRASSGNVILSAEEVVRFFAAAPSLKHRTALMTAYAAGLRGSEVVRLRVADIET